MKFSFRNMGVVKGFLGIKWFLIYLLNIYKFFRVIVFYMCVISMLNNIIFDVIKI